MKIKNITQKELWINKNYSKIYLARIGDVSLILKEIEKPDLPLSNIIRSYENYNDKKLFEIKEIAKVYDFELREGKVFILMEDLSEYKNLSEAIILETERREAIFKKMIDLFKTIWDRGILNYDFTIINFLVKDDEIKMIDLDLLTDKNFIDARRLLWFFERIDFVRGWYTNAGFNEEVTKIKLDAISKWRENNG